ncbi:hypothetical protein [Gloeobacter kilaueensis]|uniref:Uncharacterized protein n=1 Tax=Gloeobacter kilaueensis (strain ATCC BAA-2537 / CCAP 1431/1 / ULC 316 / JS1) TaxID=1183438 RepID=U5QHN8_GLOK1|nr:hypothetical protein [Gloeobacter kilaueensis]AGY58436.1 hypothetical protein GKIL_2190 [Gloeobacter kilaueensis JS1]
MNAIRLPILTGCLKTRPATPASIYKFLRLSGRPVGNNVLYLRGRSSRLPVRIRLSYRPASVLERLIA